MVNAGPANPAGIPGPTEYFSADPSDYGVARLLPLPSAQQRKNRARAGVKAFNIVALPLAALFLSVAAYLSLPSESVRQSDRSHHIWALPAGLFLAAILAIILRITAGDSFQRRRNQKRAARELYRRGDTDLQWLPVVGNSLDRIAKGFEWAEDKFTKQQQGISLSVLLSPSSYSIRLVHAIESRGQTLSHEVIRRVESLNGFELKSCPFPIHKERKGRLAHRFAISVNGVRNSTLSSSDGEALTLTLLTRLADHYLPNLRDKALWKDSDWLTVLTAIASESPVKPESPLLRVYISNGFWRVEKSDRKFADVLKSISERIVDGGSSEHQADAVIQLISDLSQNYVLWTVLPAEFDRGCHITTEYCTRLDVSSQSWYEKQRISYGLASRSVVLPLEMSREAQSYHLDLAVPDETYVYRTRVTLSRTKSHTASAPAQSELYPIVRPGVLSNPVIRTSRPGFDVAHVYARGAATLLAKDTVTPASVPLLPSVHFEFREVPPGNLIWALIISGYITGLSWTVSIYYSLVFPANAKDMATIWTTLLFGLPAILAGFLLSRFTKENLKQSSFVTLGLLAACMANAFFVMCVAVLLAYNKWSWSWNLHATHVGWLNFDFSAERVVAIMPWAIVVITSTTLFMLSLFFTVVRRRRFKSRLYGEIY